MAATIPGFPAQEFIDGIHLAMSLGTPVGTDRPVFVFRDVKVVTGAVDAGGTPFDVAVRPTVTPGAEVVAPCAIEYLDVQGQVLATANVIPSSLRLTIVGQEDWDAVRGFWYVRIAGERWFYKTSDVLALDVVPVHVITCTAEDDA